MLAGGAGTRFGRSPKGLATVGGRRVIDRVSTALSQAVDDLLLVANDPGTATWLPDVPWIADAKRGLGPLGGIHTALAHTRRAIVVVAWDMPFISPHLLVELRRRGRAGYRAVVPESGAGRLEPACAYYDVECQGEIGRWLDGGRSGATAFLEQCQGVQRMAAAEVERFGDPARLFFNINTMMELEQAEAMVPLSERESSRP